MAWDQAQDGWGQTGSTGSTGTTGAVWESYRFDLTQYDTGSIAAGTTDITDVGGTATLTLTPIYTAACADITLGAAVGLTVSTITGNFDTDPPGIEFDPSQVFTDYDPATDEIAVTASITGSGGGGTFLLINRNPRMDHHLSVGCVGGNRYYRRRLGGGTVEYSVAGAAQTWHLVHYTGTGGAVRGALGSAEPTDPYAATTLRQPATLENLDPLSGTTGYTAAALRFAIVGIQAGSVVCAEFTIWRLKKDDA